MIPNLGGWSYRLEDRTLLSTVTVTTTTDSFDSPSNVTVGTLGNGGPDGKISLREAITAVTNTSGANTVVLPAGNYNLTSSTGEMLLGNLNGQNITIQGQGAGTTIINQMVAGNRIFNLDNNQAGNIAVSLTDLTISGATNVNRVFGGGAILAGGPGDSLSISNSVFQNNSTSNGNLSISRNGGAIGYSGGGNLTITNSTFLNNVAGGNANASCLGGAIAFNNSTNVGVLTIINSTFTKNSSSGSGGGALGGAVYLGGVGSSSISGSTFTNNSAGSDTNSKGGALIFAGINGSSSLAIANSTFVGNSATQGGAIDTTGGNLTITGSRFFNNVFASGTPATSGSALANTGASVTANNNWWGADAFPNSTGTDTVVTTAGSTTVSNHLSLTLNPAATQIVTNSTTTLTAQVVSTSAPTTTVAGTALDGLALSFAPGTLGSVNPTSVTIVNGGATSTFTSGSAIGTTNPSITLDNGVRTTSITVIGAPTANSQTVADPFNTARSITLTGSDPNSPPLSLTYSIRTAPTHGTLSGTAPNLTYTPSAGYNGSDSFTFTVNNGFATSSPGTVTINVSPGVPKANAQTVAIAHNSAGTPITLTGSDPDSPPLTLTYAVATGPLHGTLSGTAPNLTYTPAVGYHGADSFTFVVSNGTNTSSPASVTLNVAIGTPTANAQAVTTNQNTAVAIALTGTDDDTPALALSYMVSSSPAHGTLSGTAPNLTYTPTAGYAGPDSFTFTVSNGTNQSAAAAVNLTVNRVQASVSGTVGVGWGTSGAATLQTNADGLRLLAAGRTTSLPWLGINKVSITLSQAATLSASDISVTGINVANYGPVSVSGSGTTYTITLAQPINAADRVTISIGNANIATFTRRLDVLPGDYNDDGAVTMQDAIGIRNSYFGIAGAVPTIFGDINGDGVVDSNDYNEARRRIGTVLP